MLLHGPPETGKSFVINRLQECTTVEMRITATSGIAATSLKGTTILYVAISQQLRRPKEVIFFLWLCLTLKT